MIDLALATSHLKQVLAHPPSRSSEEWRYADLQFLQKNAYALFSVEIENVIEVLAKEKKVVLTMRSPFSQKWSGDELPPGLSITLKRPAHVWTSENIFSQMTEGFKAPEHVFVFESSWDPEWLVELVWNPRETMAQGQQFLHKNLIFCLDQGVQVFLHEKSFLNQKQFVNIEAEYFLAANSHLKIFKAEKGQMDGRGCQTSRLSLQKNAHVEVLTTTTGATWSRHNVYAELLGEDSSVQLLAASILQNNEYVDHQTWMDHKAGQTTSSQRYVDVLGDESHGVFNGRVSIRQDAQKVSAEQNSRNLLLSKKARVDTKPELLIDADDVKAKHGATVGQLNPDELFYLLSRGIDPDKAQQMLIKGFVNDIGDRISPRFQEFFFKEISSSLSFLAEAR